MNVAIYLVGQLRTFLYTANSLTKNLIRPTDADVFVHVWKKNLPTGKLDHSKIKADLPDASEELIRETYENVKSVDIKNFKEKYHDELDGKKVPKKIRELEPKHYKGNLPVFWRTYNCHKDAGEEYDVIVRTRPDLILNENLSNLCYKAGNSDPLFHADYAIDPSFQLSDKLAFGSFEQMDKYCRVWERLEDIWSWEKYNNGRHQTNLVGERLLYWFAREEGIPLRSKPIDCYILRSNLKPARNF